MKLIIFVIIFYGAYIFFSQENDQFVLNGLQYNIKYIKDDISQRRGLGFIKKNEWPDNKILFFVGTSHEVKNFWMRNTFFNIDLFYLDQYCKVIKIERNNPFYEDDEPIEKIPKIPSYKSYHVMEMKSNTVFSNKIKEGDLIPKCYQKFH